MKPCFQIYLLGWRHVMRNENVFHFQPISKVPKDHTDHSFGQVLSSNRSFVLSTILSHLSTIHEILVPQIPPPQGLLCFNSIGSPGNHTFPCSTPPLGYPRAPASPGVHAHLPRRSDYLGVLYRSFIYRIEIESLKLWGGNLTFQKMFSFSGASYLKFWLKSTTDDDLTPGLPPRSHRLADSMGVCVKPVSFVCNSSKS